MWVFKFDKREPELFRIGYYFEHNPPGFANILEHGFFCALTAKTIEDAMRITNYLNGGNGRKVEPIGKNT
jgi:hypothetical protein